MATIGTFTKNETGGFSARSRTLTLNVQGAVPPRREDERQAPDFRSSAGQTEFGAAWKQISKDGRDYLSVKPISELPRADLRLARRDRGQRRASADWSRRNSD